MYLLLSLLLLLHQLPTYHTHYTIMSERVESLFDLAIAHAYFLSIYQVRNARRSRFCAQQAGSERRPGPGPPATFLPHIHRLHYGPFRRCKTAEDLTSEADTRTNSTQPGAVSSPPRLRTASFHGEQMATLLWI